MGDVMQQMDVRRRSLLASMGSALVWPIAASADAADWEQKLGYPSGWPPGRSWTEKSYRVGNYSGGYEQMFRARTIAAPAQASPLTPLTPLGAKAFESVAARATSYMRAWPVT